MSCKSGCKIRGKKPGRAVTTEKNKWISFVSLGGGVADGMGGTLTGETEVYATMASIWPLSRTFTGDETIENMRNELKTVYQIKTWYKSGLTADMEIRFGSREFEIIGIQNKEEANVSLDFMCYERF